MSKKVCSILMGIVICAMMMVAPENRVYAAESAINTSTDSTEFSQQNLNEETAGMVNIISYPAYRVDPDGTVTRVMQPRTFNGSLVVEPGVAYYWTVEVKNGSNNYVVSWASNTTFNIRFAGVLFGTLHSVDVNNRSMYSGSFNFDKDGNLYFMVENTSSSNKTLLGVYVNGK